LFMLRTGVAAVPNTIATHDNRVTFVHSGVFTESSLDLVSRLLSSPPDSTAFFRGKGQPLR
jgi:hypothetical protein